jgi:uncharacterized membrane protein YhhN
MSTVSVIDKKTLARRLLRLFFVFLAADIIFVALEKEHWRFFSKFFLMPILAAYFLYSVRERSITRWIVAALIFSWIGDVLLQFEKEDPLFFLLGLSSFLLAHVFYIIFFHQIRVKEQLASRWWLIIPVAAYYVGLIFLLLPNLGDMTLPVRVYGIVISLMLLLALHCLFMKDRVTGRVLVAGALLFVISDSVLAINKFYASFDGAGVIVMLTYGLAQLLIVLSATRYVCSGK